jgi:hypothetical protein
MLLRVSGVPDQRGAETPGAQGRQYDDGLHACAAAGWARGTESAPLHAEQREVPPMQPLSPAETLSRRVRK